MPAEAVAAHAPGVQVGWCHRARVSFRKYRVLLRYALRYRRGWATILALTLLSTGIGLLTPLPLKILVDNVLGHHHPGTLARLLPGGDDKNVLLLWVAGAELIFFALGSLLDVALTFLWIKVGQSMVFDLARDLFARVQRRSLREHNRMPIGETMARVGGDSWCVHTVVDELCFTPLHVVVTVAGVVAAMASINAELTLLAVGVVPGMLIASLLLGRMTRDAAHAQRDIEGEINAHVQQTLAGISVVQAFGQEDRHHRRFEDLARAAIRSRMRVALAGGLNGLSSGMITTLGSGLLLLLMANSVLDGKLTVGGLLVFMAYAATLQQQLGGLTGIYTKLQSARASIDRAVEVLDAEPEVVECVGASALSGVRGHVRYEGVSFAYETGRPVLHGVSLEARPGQVVAIVGATGAGKSTLVSLLPRFFDPDEGVISIDGRDLRELELGGVRAAVSLVLQESFLFPISLAENIAYGRPGAGRAEIEAAARAANAHEFIARLPEGYETVVGERGATLSGGERQRVSIARALLKDAPILILDEPTSALDAETEGQLMGALENLMAGRTTLIIAHRLSTIRGADRIVVLEHGRVVEDGSHEELLDRDGLYARLHKLQFAERQPVSAT